MKIMRLTQPKVLLWLVGVAAIVGFSFFASKPKRSHLLLLDVSEIVKLPPEIMDKRGITITMENESYNRGKKLFQCNDKLNEINIEYINDDYCDCKDCSDEPGTFLT